MTSSFILPNLAIFTMVVLLRRMVRTPFFAPLPHARRLLLLSPVTMNN